NDRCGKDWRVAEARPHNSPPNPVQRELLYHFCRMQLPTVALVPSHFADHLQRTFDMFQAKEGNSVSWENYLENIYPLDWYVASACLEGDRQAWEYLLAAGAG